MGIAVRSGRRRNEYVCRVFEHDLHRSQSIAHARKFTPIQLLFGHDLGPPELEPLDLERELLDPTSYMAERLARERSACKAWLEAEEKHRVSRAQNMRTRGHQHLPSTRVKYWRADVDRSGVAQLASSLGRRTRTKNKGGRLAWSRRGALSR